MLALGMEIKYNAPVRTTPRAPALEHGAVAPDTVSIAARDGGVSSDYRFRCQPSRIAVKPIAASESVDGSGIAIAASPSAQ